ncbi:hypothetical protein D3C81_2113260 [compost metagenome]
MHDINAFGRLPGAVDHLAAGMGYRSGGRDDFLQFGSLQMIEDRNDRNAIAVLVMLFMIAAAFFL